MQLVDLCIDPHQTEEPFDSKKTKCISLCELEPMTDIEMASLNLMYQDPLYDFGYDKEDHQSCDRLMSLMSQDHLLDQSVSQICKPKSIQRTE